MISSNLTKKAAHHIMFTENFEKHLYTKRELKFNKDGKFKILMMSDIQEPLNIDERTIPAINKLIDKVKPDFIILGGDNCDHNSVSDKEKLKAYLDTVTYPMESRKIPWASLCKSNKKERPVEPDALLLSLFLFRKQVRIVFHNNYCRLLYHKK